MTGCFGVSVLRWTAFRWRREKNPCAAENTHPVRGVEEFRRGKFRRGGSETTTALDAHDDLTAGQATPRRDRRFIRPGLPRNNLSDKLSVIQLRLRVLRLSASLQTRHNMSCNTQRVISLLESARTPPEAPPMRLEILNTGTALLLGNTVNTHAAWLRRELFQIRVTAACPHRALSARVAGKRRVRQPTHRSCHQ